MELSLLHRVRIRVPSYPPTAHDIDVRQRLRPLATMLAARGFTCLEVDLASPEEPATSEALMQRFEEGECPSAYLFYGRLHDRGVRSGVVTIALSQIPRLTSSECHYRFWHHTHTMPLPALTSHIRLTMIPFAPVIFARGPGALIAQTYISSHPASGLLLISPPVSNAHLRSTSEAKGQNLLPTHLPEFNFEPQFPCAILCTQQEAAALAGHRMWKDDHVDKLVTRDEKAIDGQEGLVKIEQWLDEVGV